MQVSNGEGIAKSRFVITDQISLLLRTSSTLPYSFGCCPKQNAVVLPCYERSESIGKCIGDLKISLGASLLKKCLSVCRCAVTL
jgi:hypothetical protein